MDKEKKNRSGSMSNETGKNESGDRAKTSQPGAPATSNRQTGGNQRREKDESDGAERNTTKKGANSI